MIKNILIAYNGFGNLWIKLPFTRNVGVKLLKLVLKNGYIVIDIAFIHKNIFFAIENRLLYQKQAWSY